MPEKKREFAVEDKGRGRPDFSGKVHDVEKGKIYPEFWPTKDERFKVFLKSFPIGSELPAGDSVKLLDIETNLPCPYSSPAGYYARSVEWLGSFNQPCILEVTLDSLDPFTLFMPAQAQSHEYEHIAFFDTRYWDFEAEDPHTWNFVVYNIAQDDQFEYPRGIASYGTYIYVADTYNHRIVKRLASDLSFVSKIGSQGSGNDQFDRPRGIACDDTYLYVADTYNCRIVKRKKSDLSFVSKIGDSGSGDDQFNNPGGIAFYGTYIYVADTSNHRIVKRLASDLSFVAKVGSQGVEDDQFSYPAGIATDQKYGTFLYIADSDNDRIVKRSASDLSFVSKIGSEGSGDDQFDYPAGIASYGTYIYVADGDNDRIVKRVAYDLTFISKIGSLGSGEYSNGRGSADIVLVLQKAGTEKMEKKTVKCSKCGYMNTVPLKQTKITCQKCSHKFVVPFYGGEVV